MPSAGEVGLDPTPASAPRGGHTMACTEAPTLAGAHEQHSSVRPPCPASSRRPPPPRPTHTHDAGPRTAETPNEIPALAEDREQCAKTWTPLSVAFREEERNRGILRLLFLSLDVLELPSASL